MKTPHRLVLLLAIACSGLIVMIGTKRLAQARAEAVAAVAHHLTVQRDAEVIQHLRSKEERISPHAKPTEDLIAMVGRALAEAGLPGDRLSDLRNESDAALPAVAAAPSYRRQSIAFTLRSMTPGDLGAFLARWSEVQAVWRITRITLTAPRGRGGGSPEEGRFDINLIVSAIYISEE